MINPPSSFRVDWTTGDFDKRRAQKLAKALISDCQPSQPFDAADLLARNPELRSYPSVVSDLALEEYERRLVTGESVDCESFAARFGEQRRAIFEMLGVYGMVNDDPYVARGLDRLWSGAEAGKPWLRFDLLEELGKGAFSQVFLARDPTMGNRLIVVKIGLLGRLEAQAAGKLIHPRIVPVYELCPDAATGTAGMCMPYFSRATLHDVLCAAFDGKRRFRSAGEIKSAVQTRNSTGPGPDRPNLTGRGLPAGWSYVDGILEIGAQVADALSFTHGKEILHCDIKPSNILLTNDGQALLIDFNLAFPNADEASIAGGTPPYMAPEQLPVFISGEAARSCVVDARTDIFGLGATLYELLSGRFPFGPLPKGSSSASLARTMLELQRRGPAPLRQLNPHIDRRTARVIERCLAFDPAQRPQTAAELALLLRKCRTLPRRAWRQAAMRPRLRRGAIALMLVVFLALVALLLSAKPYVVREQNKGRAAFDKAQYTLAIDHLTRAITADPELAEARFQRVVHLHQRSWEAAAADFQALRDPTHDGTISACLGYAAAGRGNHLQAVGYFRLAIQQGFETAAVWNDLGHALLQVADAEKAAECFENALELDPTLQAALWNRARIELAYSASGNGFPDTSYIEAAIDQDPENALLNLDAAYTYAALARLSGKIERTLWEELSVDYVRQSLQLGLPADELAGVFILLPEIKDHQRLQGVVPGSSAAPPEIRKLPELLLVMPLGVEEAFGWKPKQATKSSQ
jgi:eukaryotic-like serine/threonine-protein kinase